MTGRDLMPFGKHKGTPLADVPKDYRIWLCAQEGFATKNPQLYAYFTEGEKATASPKELQNIDIEKGLLETAPPGFVSWWRMAYGERLRKDGEVVYIGYLRMALTTWQSAMTYCKGEQRASNPPKPQPTASSPTRKTDLARLSDEDVPF